MASLKLSERFVDKRNLQSGIMLHHSKSLTWRRLASLFFSYSCLFTLVFIPVFMLVPFVNFSYSHLLTLVFMLVPFVNTYYFKKKLHIYLPRQPLNPLRSNMSSAQSVASTHLSSIRSVPLLLQCFC